ncbi:MAG: response regulator [Planctomycetota bacterium]|nr:response regulator [Planctomycetota bacterium]
MDSKEFSAIILNGELPAPEEVAVENIVEDILATYIEEMDSLLSRLEAAALSLESGDDCDEALAEVRRVLHSIKGDSGMCGVIGVHDVCHELESFLDELDRAGCLADVLLKVKDWTETVIRHLSCLDIADAKNREIEQHRSKPKLKALVIDDDIVCRNRLKMLLSDFFDCTFACDGRKGLSIYEQSLREQSPFELITLDINMPEMNGHETLEAIRRTEEQRGIGGLDVVKVIMTTSESSSKHVFAAFREGCEAYVVKTEMGGKLLDAVVQLGLLKVVKVQKAYVLD